MRKLPSYNDLQSGTRVELMKTYKLDQRQMEQVLRKQLDGAAKTDLEKAYKDFYNRK